MHKLLPTLLLMAYLPFAGCDVNIKIDEDEGVQIKAPGVDISISDDEGVGINAAGMDIEISDEEGIDIRPSETGLEDSEESGLDSEVPEADFEVSDDQGNDSEAPEVDLESSDDPGGDAEVSGVEPLVDQKGTAMPTQLLAEQASKFDLSQLLDEDVLVFLIPILAILAATTVVITIAVIRHRERMEKLRLGIDPDDPSPEGNENTDPYKTTSQYDS